MSISDEIYHQACVNKKNSNKYIFSADLHLGGRVTKMAAICQRVVILLQILLI